MPEGDTIAWAAKRIRPVLERQVPDEISSPRNPGWPQRLTGQAVTRVTTHGKHLFLHFEGGLVLHSHLGMSGYWSVVRKPPTRSVAQEPPTRSVAQEPPTRSVAQEPPTRSATWLMLRVQDRRVVQRHGPTLELMTEGRVRFDQRLSALGPDVLAPEFDRARFLARLRADDPTRALGDALLDQRNVAGIGNIWKAEGCWEARVDPWRPVADVNDEEALAVIDGVRPRMQLSAENGPRTIAPRIYKRTGQPCPRCGARVRARGQGDANRTTYWCPGCQT